MLRILLFCLVVLAPAWASAHDVEKGGIHIADPWVKAPIGQGKVAAGYLEVIEMEGNSDRLIGARSDIAARTELHTHSMDNGVMRMRRLDGLDISPMGGVELQPGGHHIMLMGLKRKLVPGEKLVVTLIFEGVGEVAIPFVIRGN